MAEENKNLPAEIKNEMTGGGGFNLAPSNLGEAMQFAKMMSNTDMVPKDYAGKPANIMVAVQMGAEIGLKPMQSLQNISVINGRPSVWGDTAIALVRIHPECEYIDEYLVNKKGEKTTGDDYDAAVCKIKRKGQEEQIRIFSLSDAETAGLLKKGGVWKSYRKRMLQMRPRGYALRDVFPDALKGLSIAEEARDLPAYSEQPTDITPVNERISTPEFDVPAIDTDRSVMVDEDVVDVETGEVQDDAVESEPAAEESPFEEETEVITAESLITRIKTIANHFEHKNWMKKHLNEINALSVDDQALVMNAYADKGEEINDTAPGNALSEDGYKALLNACESKEDLNKLWFDRIEKEVVDSKAKIRLRTVMNKKADDFGGK